MLWNSSKQQSGSEVRRFFAGDAMRRAWEIFLSPIDPSRDLQRQFRGRFALTMTSLGVLFLVSFSVANFQVGFVALALADVILACCLLLAILYMHRTGNIEQGVRFSIAAFLLWFVGTIPISVLPLLWLPVFPLVAFFGLGRHEGLPWSLAFLLVIMLEYMVCRGMGIPIASDFFLASTLGSLLIVILGILFYQRLLEMLQAALSRQAKKLLQTQRMESIGVLAGGVAHDFNNMLVGLMGNIELIMMDLGREHPAYPQLEGMLSSAQRGASLVRQLLDFSGQGGWEEGPMEVNRLLEEIRPGLVALLGSAGRLRYDLQSGLPPVNADPHQFEQMMVNLVNNAAEAVGPMQNPDVLVRTGLWPVRPGQALMDAMDARDGPFLFIQVVDHGQGIDAKVLPRVFDPFFTTKKVASGLGLAALAGFVRSLHGAVDIETARGRGTSVTIWLPVTAKAGEPEWGAPLGARARVLIIDDRADVRAGLRHMLDRLGVAVMEAGSALSAMKRLKRRRHRIDALMLEATLVEMQQGLLEQIRRLDPTVRLIVYGALEELDGVHRARAAGAVFLHTPFRSKDLITVLALSAVGDRDDE